ncbi:MAG: hypothetical protein E6G62_10095 [Actinobacteria bacterium]|nr:MAG: hypothetical protein E6G62_10095 [Actinomycetota bacterium]
MAPKTRQPDIDDEPQRRESPVRHAHAVAAARHGRASSPGYLGLPQEEEQGTGADPEEETGEDEQGASAQSTGDSRSDMTRAPSRGRKSAERGEATKPSRARAGDDPGKPTRSTSKGTQGKKGAAKAKGDSSRAKAGARRRPSPAKATRSDADAGSRTSASKATRSGGGRKPKSKSKGAAASMAKASRSAGGKGAPPHRSGKSRSAQAAVKSKVAAVSDSLDGETGKHASKAARHLAAVLARRALGVGARAVRSAVGRAGSTGTGVLLERVRRLPIQRSIDVAVPIEIAWEQWMEFRHLPDGSHRLVDIERDGDRLRGELAGVSSRDWQAEVIDERENESFAWRSTEGSDSVGLLTFHELADRLTRLELDLDVRPVDLAEAASLTMRFADRRVEAELRRFKAHAELLSPDIYDELLASQNGGSGDEEETH